MIVSSASINTHARAIAHRIYRCNDLINWPSHRRGCPIPTFKPLPRHQVQLSSTMFSTKTKAETASLKKRAAYHSRLLLSVGLACCLALVAGKDIKASGGVADAVEHHHHASTTPMMRRSSTQWNSTNWDWHSHSTSSDNALPPSGRAHTNSSFAKNPSSALLPRARLAKEDLIPPLAATTNGHTDGEEEGASCHDYEGKTKGDNVIEVFKVFAMILAGALLCWYRGESCLMQFWKKNAMERKMW